ncbi:MAG: lasso RiPP family leader peptide-containing protein [Gammaproteobacteria bacterium]|nr:lasso RiPP family leader peptide-containing protein [Gammaproteobacteria bacterium]MCP5426122.1 lasso RiPP family leader peptide-containing protein [Gammaproteobacteria bacterium]
MTTPTEKIKHEAPDNPCPNSSLKRPYSPPQLVRYGSLRKLTTGGSVGTGDSGTPLTKKGF